MEKRKKLKTLKYEYDDNNWWWLICRGTAASFLSISVFSIWVRVAESLHPYSGAGKPPKNVDFEAQRHWMEITLNIPASEWYRNSTTNDLSYWGLDYPPLTAYQSYFHDLILRNFHLDSVILYTSRGHKSYLGKLLMRWTVLSSNVLMFFPAVFYFAFAYYSGSRSGHKSDVAWYVAMILLNPCQILIDHGHFQYNCISLGLTIGAATAILSSKDLLACFLFSLALNHKQVLSRLAPFERGIYEDYVANFWCTTSVLVKWKRLFTILSLKLLSFGATISASLPSMIQQIWVPSKQGFLYGLRNTSLSFYMLSYQVHDMSILLPLLPASFLAMEEPFLFKWMMHYSLLSMFPLLCRDELILPYISLSALFVLLYHAPGRRQDTTEINSPANLRSFMIGFRVLCSLILHVVYLAARLPEKYPFLFEPMIMLLCFSQFVLVAGYTNIKQSKLLKDSALENKEKYL